MEEVRYRLHCARAGTAGHVPRFSKAKSDVAGYIRLAGKMSSGSFLIRHRSTALQTGGETTRFVLLKTPVSYNRCLKNHVGDLSDILTKYRVLSYISIGTASVGQSERYCLAYHSRIIAFLQSNQHLQQSNNTNTTSSNTIFEHMTSPPSIMSITSDTKDTATPTPARTLSDLEPHGPAPHNPPTDVEKQEIEAAIAPDKVSAFKGLGWLDRFLAIWILLAMIIGIVIGNFAPNAESTLQKGQFVDVSAPVAVGLLVMMYPILCKVKFETLHLALKSKQLWIQVGFSIIMNWLVAPFLMVCRPNGLFGSIH